MEKERVLADAEASHSHGHLGPARKGERRS
jgi:hypothetical protein